jgi:hypothetical protein
VTHVLRVDPSGEVRPVWWHYGYTGFRARGRRVIRHGSVIDGEAHAHVLAPKTADPTAPWQNPVYPPDMPVDQMEAIAREAAFIRAQSPGQRVCLIDEATAIEYPTHTHPYDECMNYRHDHVVGDDEPWTYWQLYDQVATRFMAPPAVPPPPPVGWNSRARVNERGISIMDGISSGWQGFTWATMIGASRIKLGPGSNSRVTIMGNALIGPVYIGPIAEPTKPFLASYVYALTFNGGQSLVTPQPPDYVATSDPLPHGLDLPNGVMIYSYVPDVAPGQPTAYLGTRNSEQDWYSRWAYGNWSGHIDLFYPTAWVNAPFGSIAVLEFDAFY